ncbi:MAG: biopolymer transporter ExbD [Gammaproteobacteria bacterium]|nr:biopolymer transporter ExbD [Gammaproteobacteria bacterium]
MSRRAHSDIDEAEIDLTPMLDCVFIMLIFFIVTTSFTKEAGIEMNRPSGSASTPPTDKKVVPKVVAITLKNDDSIVIGGRETDIRLVGAAVERALAADAKSPVIIQAEKGSSVQPLVQIVDQAKMSGAKSVSVATIEGSK